MTHITNQPLRYVTQDTIAALNEIVAGGYINSYINVLNEIEENIFNDSTGTFVQASGQPTPGTFQILRTLRALKADLRTLNTPCPDLPE